MKSTKLQHAVTPRGTSRRGSSSSLSVHSSSSGEVSWTAEDYVRVHNMVKESGKFNFEGCRIPLPTAIRYDRIEAALGSEVTAKERRVLSLLEFGMPINCKPNFGVHKPQKNHYSAVSHKEAIDDYLAKNIEINALLGPFKVSPIAGLCYSPLMSVPKDVTKRRVIVDFSFPPGNSVNDGISKVSYLEFDIEFSLPSVQAMAMRIIELGPGCLLYKRDLKGAFRQFSSNPGDYVFAGIFWGDVIYIDTRLAMGLRSASYCCQSVTEIVAKIAGRRAHVMVYLDDFGEAELTDRAHESFEHIGWLLKHFGLEEAREKGRPPRWIGLELGLTQSNSTWLSDQASSRSY